MATSRAHARRGAVRSARASARPGLERLESRQLLATYAVTNTADSGAGSFRQAILDADATPSTTNVITFAITAGSGVRHIAPLSALPAITTPMTIDGTTQPGYIGNPIVEIDGSQAGSGSAGLTISGGGTTLRGLVVGGFSGPGIAITTGGNNVLVQDFVGVDASGLAPNGNAGGGVVITNSAGNTLGGTTSTTEVVVSGNVGAGIHIVGAASTGNTILGGFIGTNLSGTAAIGNSGPGIEIDGAASNSIGTSTTGGRNIISGNGQTGISLVNGASKNTVVNNYIGSTVSGTAALANGVAGVEINASPSNTIGGTSTGVLNVISGNAGSGISIDGAASSGNLIDSNDIGVNNVGTAALANAADGLRINGAVNTTVGGSVTGVGNVISANLGNGISLLGGATGTLIQGNFIGTDSSSSIAIGNTLEGIFIQGSSTNTIGALASATGVVSGVANQIANSGQYGVLVASGTANTIRQNATYANAVQAIGLAGTGNNNLVAPKLNSSITSGGSTTIQGVYTGPIGTTYTLDFYSNTVLYPTLGQGRVYIGSTTVTAGRDGSAIFSFSPANPVALNSLVTATATDSLGDTSQFSNQAKTNAPSVSLGITGSGSVNPVGVGGTLVDTFIVSNSGPASATNVTVTDTIPSGVTLLMTTASQGTITLSGSSFSVNLGTIAQGATATVSLSYQPLVAGTISDKASVTTADVTVSNPQAGSATINTVAQPSAYLQLADSTSPASAVVGGLVAFNVTATNKGPSPAAGVTITDVIPAGASIISASTTQGSSPTVGNTVTASLGTIPAGGSATVTIVVQPSIVGTLTDSAALSSTTVNPYASNVTASASATITATATPSNPSGPTGDGPKVVGVARSGVRTMPTKYAIGFDSSLFVGTAQNLANYSIVDLGANGKQSKKLAIASATFDSANNSVTLAPSKRINLHDQVRLTINGLAPDGVTGSNGLLLDGAATGQPGSNYSVTFIGFGPSSGLVSAASVHPRGPKGRSRG